MGLQIHQEWDGNLRGTVTKTLWEGEVDGKTYHVNAMTYPNQDDTRTTTIWADQVIEGGVMSISEELEGQLLRRMLAEMAHGRELTEKDRVS